MNNPILVPSGDTSTDEFARELAYALGNGYNSGDGTLQAEDIRVWGGSLAEVNGQLSFAIQQAFPQQATVLLEAWERRLGIPISDGASTEDRQASIITKRRGTGGGSSFLMLAAVRRIDPTATIHTNSATEVAVTDPRGVFLFSVQVSSDVWLNTTKLEAIRAVINQMKPAFTDFNTPVSAAFLTDDPNSLTDRDVLGA